ncbi:hypothetical protein ACVINW_001437 [Bradyrhizobium sp. USDA 4461]
MSNYSPHDLLKKLQELHPNASPAELKELMLDEMQRSPETLGKALFDDVFDAFVNETGHRPRDVEDTMDSLLSWLKKPIN